jgi:hypothetical protein
MATIAEPLSYTVDAHTGLASVWYLVRSARARMLVTFSPSGSRSSSSRWACPATRRRPTRSCPRPTSSLAGSRPMAASSPVRPPRWPTTEAGVAVAAGASGRRRTRPHLRLSRGR